ncbi:MAG: hypothetical protein IPM88_02085 [Nitrospira sp.]|nr:hypothetical protein [Nitrospira sp.]
MSALLDSVMQYLQALAVAVLVGKVVLLSFVVAPILARNLDQDAFGKSFAALAAYYVLRMGAATAGCCRSPCSGAHVAGICRC